VVKAPVFGIVVAEMRRRKWLRSCKSRYGLTHYPFSRPCCLNILVAVLQNAGPPGREPAVTEAERSAMMAHYFKKQEEMKKLAEVGCFLFNDLKLEPVRALTYFFNV
jgi:hypothetical protein